MSVESTVYSPNPAISLSHLIESAHGADLELRAFSIQDESILHPAGNAEAPFYDAS